MPLDAILQQIAAQQSVQTPQHQVTPQVTLDKTLRPAMYGAQAYDAFNTAQFLRSSPPGVNRFETDALMRPFSHGGAPTMLAGFAIYDVLKDLFTRHNPKLRAILEAAQLVQNVGGIAKTNASRGTH